MASGSHDGTARVWDTATWQAVGAPLAAGVEDRGDSVEAVTFSPDGRTLAMGSMGGSILLWNLATRERVVLPKAHANAVNCLAFSPDGRTLASGSWDETIRLWNVSTGRELMILNSKDLNLGFMRSLSFSPDGTQLLAGGATVAVVWSAAPSIWDDPTLAAKQLEPLLRSDSIFQNRVRTLSEIPRLREALAALEVLRPDDQRVRAALAATRANWHAARQQWQAASEQVDRLLRLKTGTPELWLQTPGLLRLADAVVRQDAPEKLSRLVPTNPTFNSQLAQQFSDQGRSELAAAAQTKARQLFERKLAKEPKNSILAAELTKVLLIDTSKNANSSEFYKKRLATMKLTDPWIKLAAAYHIVGDQQAIDTLLEHHSAVATAIGDLYTAAQDWERAIVEYRKLVTDEPAATALLTKLAKAYQSASRTNEAVSYLATLSAANPKDTMLGLKVAALQAWFGQDKELAATRQRILAFAKDTDEAATARYAAKACSILPSTKSELESALALGRSGIKLGNGMFAQWGLLALGMAEYRSGNDAAADKTLLAAADADPKTHTCRVHRRSTVR